MSFVRATSLLLLALVRAEASISSEVAALRSDDKPVTKVVKLIEELKLKIIQDGKIEQNMYNKYACWCETTSARKAKAIHKAMADIKMLGSKILEMKSLV